MTVFWQKNSLSTAVHKELLLARAAVERAELTQQVVACRSLAMRVTRLLGMLSFFKSTPNNPSAAVGANGLLSKSFLWWKLLSLLRGKRAESPPNCMAEAKSPRSANFLTLSQAPPSKSARLVKTLKVAGVASLLIYLQFFRK